jgi:hypothetical protein
VVDPGLKVSEDGRVQAQRLTRPHARRAQRVKTARKSASSA